MPNTGHPIGLLLSLTHTILLSAASSAKLVIDDRIIWNLLIRDYLSSSGLLGETMVYNEYNIGDLIRLEALISISGSYVDPIHLSLFVTDPNEDVMEYNYTATGTITKDSIGKYHLNYYAPFSGQYKYRYYSSGTAWGAEVKRFVVNRE